MANKKIAIIQHNEKNLDTLRTLLENNNYDVLSINTKDELSKLEDTSDVCLFLVSSYVNFISIEDVFGLIEYNYTAQHPIMFIDSANVHDKDNLLECYKFGAVDYIKKPFNSKEIIARVNIHTAQFAKLSELRLRLDKLIGLATTDQLSKFSSKMHIQAVLKHTIELNERHPSDTSVIYLKLFDVEKVVSTFGFEYGEKLIAHFSKILKKLLRESDAVGRWAGSDFIILLPYTGIAIAESVAKKLYVNLTKTEIMQNIKPNISIGITEIINGDTINSILEKAKYGMHQASKNRYDRISIA